MVNFKNLLAQTFLALTLASGAGAAMAGPMYHVDVDTSALSGKSGYLDFLIIGQGDTATTTATLSGFDGKFTGKVFENGATGSLAGAIVGSSNFYNEFALWADFGEHLVFDVTFDQIADNIAGALFEVALLDADFAYQAPTTGDVAAFNLLPGEAAEVQGSDFATVSTAAAVPEPATLLSILSGLGLLGFVRRRRA